MGLYMYSPIGLHGVVLNYLSTGTIFCITHFINSVFDIKCNLFPILLLVTVSTVNVRKRVKIFTKYFNIHQSRVQGLCRI
jgi:hypothetical protein